MSKGLFWFRRDLRLKDNHGLYQALHTCDEVVPVFVFDENILSKLPDLDRRVQFIHDQLSELSDTLQEQGRHLYVYVGDPKTLIPRLASELNVSKVFTNEDYEPYALKRDQAVRKKLVASKVDFETYKDQVIFSPEEILKDDGKPYTVYTPYRKKWEKHLSASDLKTFPSEKLLDRVTTKQGPKTPSMEALGFKPISLVSPGTAIKKSLLANYDKARDFPAKDATSHFGVHLRFGTVSPRHCAKMGKTLNATWLSELIWREFFMQILYHYPHVVTQSFRPKYDKIQWLNNKKQFSAWCEGQTGYPLVDAGMRELNETGYMHNRVRMVTASFLTKHLLIDWRWGERYFAKKLIDFDLSANNGNWQWAAGTGCDAAPYFRIFNPESQMKKFDKDGDYVKRWVPELETDDYPAPIVDHKEARERALAAYKQALG